jgi:beta-glucosidase
MTLKSYFNSLCSLVGICLISCSDNNTHLVYKDASSPIEERVEDLLARMTLEEKVQLLTISDDPNEMGDKSVGFLGFMDNSNNAGSSAAYYNTVARYMKEKTKYGIVGLRNGEGVFAYMGNGTTAFPQPLAQAAAWDEKLVASVAGVVGEEMRSRGVRLAFSPVLNIGRDPRWGRTGETYGEDPYLVSRMGVAYIKTAQNKGIATTMKHFAGNTGHDGKFGAAVFYSERYYREFEFPAYEAAIKEGKAQAVMMAYNTGDGIPFTQNEWMMTKYLKGELGFDGVIMSDGGGLRLVDEAFGIDTANSVVAAKAINAGCDIGLDAPIYYKTGLLKAVQDGLVSEKTVTESARRMLRVIFRTGVYDNPYVDPDHAAEITDCAAHRATALDVSKKTMVLLKNDNKTLPFSKNIKNVLVTGQLGDKLLINHYGGWGRKEVTVLEGIKNLLPQVNVQYETGAHVGYTFYPAIEPSAFYTNEKDVKKSGLKAEYFDNSKLEGTPVLVKTDPNIDFDWKEGAPDKFDNDKFSIRWSGKLKAPYSGMFTFGVHSDDGLTVYIDDKMVVDMVYGSSNFIFVQKGKMYLEKGKEYSIRAEFIEKGGKAFAKLGWDANPTINIPKAIATAKKADAIVAVVGMYDDENGDRAILNLDEGQEQLILELAKLGKPMVVVIQTGNVITMRRWADKVPAILQAWYPGEEGGNAIVQTLWGDNNPSAKLPITIPIETGQVPLTYNRFPGKDTRSVDRGLDKFFDVGNEPMFYFGHGLSYTTFEYSNLQLSKNTLTENDSIIVSVDIKNTGAVAGEEIVQLYIHDILATISRPIKELKAFGKISLTPGETKTVQLKLKGEQLKFYDINMKKTFENGDVEVMVGASSNDIKFKTIIQCQ